ncbi:MAG: asparagine synthase (glutamine-hydrolyzing) [Chloroflexi bacterium]|nr:asparagine synthase (glutamine-hydrolyzing) [Chloroflexota bacterium]
MCGITGFIDTSKSTSSNRLIATITRMSDQIRHRGPDDFGTWIDDKEGIALGFRRLAILDLSQSGHQPMVSANGRYVIVFNGEIYNFASLREDLLTQGHKFRGTSDTEIILASVLQWGLLTAVKKFNGMFAFALWDEDQHTLSLVRDRIGIKPMYYGRSGKTIFFGSELKSIKAHPDFKADINRDALALFLRYSYIPAPYTIYNGISKLPPASILSFQLDENYKDGILTPYWSHGNAVQYGLNNQFGGEDREAVETLESLLTRSIGERMIADVPLGAFLSGGIDSSAIVLLMQKQSSYPVKTFTIGFNETGFDEAKYAKAVANQLGTDHTELYVNPEDALAIIPRIPTLYDEPFADPSQIPTFLVSELARQSVTVSLSGDGGDELFGGYNRYFWVDRIWKRTSVMPPLFRKAIANGLSFLRPQDLARIFKLTAQNIPNPIDKAHKLTEILRASSREAIYTNLVSQWKHPETTVIGGHEPPNLITSPSNWGKTSSFTELMMAIDQVTYLPDDVLAKVDRASMGTSLEVRAPFLDDHETVEFSWRLPLHMKIRNGQGKWILRQILYKHIPREMIDRPKMGFGVPIDSWLRGPLRDWAEALLDENRLQKEGYFHPKEIRQKWAEHLAGTRNWQYELWNVLMFQAWLEAQSL